MGDFLNLMGQLFAIAAKGLDSVSPIPWPLVLALLFLPFVVVLRVGLWVLRGRVWPVTCKYYHTQQSRADKPCRTPVPGEWKYCRHHKKPGRKMSDGHVIVDIPRWQKKLRNDQLADRDDIRGVGFVSLLSNRETFLFYRGIAKRPRMILRRRRELLTSWREGLRRFRSIRPRDLIPRRMSADQTPRGVADRMPRVVRATRLTLTSFALGLILVAASVIAGGNWRAGFQYAAAAAFVLAWEAIRFGVWKSPDEEKRWVRATLVDTAKVMGVLLGVALATALVTQFNKAVEQGARTASTSDRSNRSVTGCSTAARADLLKWHKLAHDGDCLDGDGDYVFGLVLVAWPRSPIDPDGT
ncbi:hypothetical protein [Actinomadura luzonensis]|uniref:hypothetical protein n=1 Tax=Actinomadura luzonensis TaxID=2805427 RepID=UPI0027E256B6|nr:hypothetical protein [Actinomadura luzonensis]